MGWKHYMVVKAEGRQRSIVASLPATQGAISKRTNLPASTVYRNLEKLIEAGEVEVFGYVDNPRGGPPLKLYRRKEKK